MEGLLDPKAEETEPGGWMPGRPDNPVGGLAYRTWFPFAFILCNPRRCREKAELLHDKTSVQFRLSSHPRTRLMPEHRDPLPGHLAIGAGPSPEFGFAIKCPDQFRAAEGRDQFVLWPQGFQHSSQSHAGEPTKGGWTSVG
jgi:hypothetical protein